MASYNYLYKKVFKDQSFSNLLVSGTCLNFIKFHVSYYSGDIIWLLPLSATKRKFRGRSELASIFVIKILILITLRSLTNHSSKIPILIYFKVKDEQVFHQLCIKKNFLSTFDPICKLPCWRIFQFLKQNHEKK